MHRYDQACVVIPAFGEMPHLPAILEALEAGAVVPARIVVSHSGPGEADEGLRRQFPRVTFLHSDARLFAGAARNRGAAVSSEPILAFCDSDVLPARDWLEQLVRQLEASGDRFVVGSVGMARTGGYWGITNWLCEFSEQAPWRNAGEQTGGASCNMALRKRDFDRVGGFPENYRIAQDSLLFHALREAGLAQWFAPAAVVGHFNHAGMARMARHQWLHGRYFVRIRRAAQLPGAGIVRAGWLAPLLPPVKLLRILGRLLQGGVRQWGLAILCLPGLCIAMLCWGAGMARELTASPAAGHR